MKLVIKLQLETKEDKGGRYFLRLFSIYQLKVLSEICGSNCKNIIEVNLNNLRDADYTLIVVDNK